VKRAELMADDAEGYASFAIDYAGSAILGRGIRCTGGDAGQHGLG
jgi:hypothetical protein